jgi:hypothetical protein
MQFLLLLATVAIVPACKQATTVNGRVVNARTAESLSGVTVKIAFQKMDANYNWLDAGHANVTSGARGEFSAECPDMRARYVVTAERDGFYPNQDYRPARRLQRHLSSMEYQLEVRLLPIIAPQMLPKGRGEVRFTQPGTRVGWNFAARSMAPEANADIVGEPDETGKKIGILSARGLGGFVRAPGLSGEWALYNMPQAPKDGYQPRVNLGEVPEGERAAYFLRTADGSHYAKFEVLGGIQSRDTFGVRFNWIYQPNGTFGLEIPFEQPAK